MSGIYIHIPFCKKACHYCNFHFSTSQKYRAAYVDALLKEIEIKKTLPFNNTINTIYFGGGTPSQLDIKHISRIVESLYKNYPIASEIEFTIEANPDDLSIEKLKSYHALGVNRLSIGIQSFNTKDLLYLNRLHDSSMAASSIKNAQDNGFTNINIDLIYGLPTQSLKDWTKNLNTFFDLNIPHLSAYCLTVEPKTPLDVLIKKGTVAPVDETQGIRHYKKLIESIKQKGFAQYEISNFAKNECYSKHNLSYWQQKAYLGFGASAHSYYGDTRSWNISNTSAYIRNINNHIPFSESENLYTLTKYNEYVLTSLRTMWGIDLNYIKYTFGDYYLTYLSGLTPPYIQNRQVLLKENSIQLSETGKLFADKIASDFFIVM